MRTSLILIVVYLLLFCQASFSQQYTHVYYMDEGFNSIGKTKALFVGKGYNDKDTFKLDCFIEKTGVLVLSASFKDSSIGTLNGPYLQYYDGTAIQTKGYYQNNLKQGVWEDWNEDGKKTDSAFYDKGVRLRYCRYNYLYYYNVNNNGIYSYSFNDSIARNFYTLYYSDSGTVSEELRVIDDKDVWTSFGETANSVDTVASTVEIEAEFPGGTAAWTRYLEKSLGGFNPADHGAGNGKWQVIVKFIVDQNGVISNVRAETNFGHKMEETVVRLLKNGPRWKPAMNNGKAVKAYRRQPVTFIVEGM